MNCSTLDVDIWKRSILSASYIALSSISFHIRILLAQTEAGYQLSVNELCMISHSALVNKVFEVGSRNVANGCPSRVIH